MSRRPLEGIRVADFCWVGAGSYATKILADHGADVIKVESSMKVDGLRLTPPFAERRAGVNRSGYFADRNSSKRSLALNLKHEASRELARRLIASSDIVANNFTPGTMERFGLGWPTVQQLNPRAIYLAMSMQGSTGPYSHHLGYGLTMGATVGLQHLTGDPDREPIGTGTNYPDHVPNPTHAAFVVLAALRHRARTGRGQYIDLAQIEPSLSVLGPSYLQWTVDHDAPTRQKNRDDNAAPHGVYPCRGERSWVAIVVEDDDAWQTLVRVLGIAPQPSWSTFAGRKADEDRLDHLLASTTSTWDLGDLVVELRQSGVLAEPVLDAQGVVEDEQLAARGHWVRLEHAEMGASTYNAWPHRMSRTPWRLGPAAPLLGEHTDEVCREVLGLSEGEIAGLRESGVLK